MNFETMRWTEIEENIDNLWILPIGSIEQHGPHLPLNTDSMIAESFAKQVVKRIPNSIKLPVINVGAHSMPFSGGNPKIPGTISLNVDTLFNLYYEYLSKIIGFGCKNLFIINAHYENEPIIFNAIEKVIQTFDNPNSLSIKAFSWWSLLSDNESIQINENFKGWHVEHAAFFETSLMLLFDEKNTIKIDNSVTALDIPNGVYQYPYSKSIMNAMGTLGGSSHASLEAGKATNKLVMEKIIKLINE